MTGNQYGSIQTFLAPVPPTISEERPLSNLVAMVRETVPNRTESATVKGLARMAPGIWAKKPTEGETVAFDAEGL